MDAPRERCVGTEDSVQGKAQRCASSVVTHFSRHLASGALDADRFPAWRSWLKTMDATLLGGAQTAFSCVVPRAGHLYGAYAGKSRGYLIGEAGVRTLTGESSPSLGSGRVEPSSIHVRLASRDVVVLTSDGAWTPLEKSAIQRCVVSAATKHPLDLTSTLLDLARARGRADDMALVAMTVRTG